MVVELMPVAGRGFGFAEKIAPGLRPDLDWTLERYVTY
jgi:hypothetical protein